MEPRGDFDETHPSDGGDYTPRGAWDALAADGDHITFNVGARPVEPFSVPLLVKGQKVTLHGQGWIVKNFRTDHADGSVFVDLDLDPDA